MNPKPPRFVWRAFTSVLITLSFLMLLLSGIMLFASPPGRIANWTNWTLLGLTKKDWTNLHIWFSTLFLVVTVFHIVFNWRPLLGYFKDRLTRRITFRWEWAAALAVCGLVYGGTRTGIPPFSSLLAFNEDLKQSWERPAQRAPIPHAELLTLAELARKAEVELPVAISRLQARGIQGASADIVVEQLATQNQRAAQQIYEIILAEPTRGPAGRGEGRGRGGQGAGGGPGRMTLSEFCRNEGIEVAEALRRLESNGMKASPDLTLREIAVNNGYERPYELMEILRGQTR